jgi:hypothetical protein
MIPSFAIMGIHPETTITAQKIQEFASRLELTKDLNQMILNIEKVCVQACIELELELKNLNK